MSSLKITLSYILLCFVIGLGAFFTYQPHIGNQLPLLADEYVHISLAQQLLNDGVLPFTNPYIATETTHANYESGFHFFLAVLFVLLPGEPMLIYQYFATVFFVINGLLLFYLVQLWSKKYATALFAVFFFGTITSADGLLAHQYFVPLTLGITLLLVSHIFFYWLLTTHQHRYFALLAGTLLATAITYPPTLFFFLFSTGVYLFTMQHTLASYINVTRRTFFKLLLAGSILFSLLFIATLAYLKLFEEVIFHTSWSAPYDEYSLLFFFGIVPSVLALVGIWSNLREKAPGSQMLLSWFLYALLALYIFYLFEYSILVPFPRLFLFFLISVSILAGYGVSTIISLIQTQTTYISKALLIIALGISISFHMTQVTQSSVQLPTILTIEKYHALVEFDDKHPDTGVLITDPLTSIAVYPITGNKVLNVLHSNIGGGDSSAVRAFLQAPCVDKVDYLYALQPYLQLPEAQNSLFYVAFDREQHCNFLRLLPESKPDAQLYIYSLREGSLSEFLRNGNLAKMQNPTASSSSHPMNSLNTSAELVNLISGNTLLGDDWAEYYQPDGTIIGANQSGSAYDGVWDIKDGFYCYYYPSTKYSTCLAIKQVGNKLEFYAQDGTYSSSASLRPGNSLNLEQY